MNNTINSKLIVQLVILQVLVYLTTSLSVNSIENGCTAYNCKRSCSSSLISETPGDNGFKFEIEGMKDNKYVPDKVYKG